MTGKVGGGNSTAMTGVERIAAERQRQIEQEGWSPEHDDTHVDGEMADAAAVYAMSHRTRPRLIGDWSGREYETGEYVWPWDSEWWKPTPDDRLRELEKAGALIAAEIDRLVRAAAPAVEEQR